MKECRKCLQEKPVAEFCKSSKAKDGLQTWCKSCIAAYKYERRGENLATQDFRERLKEIQRLRDEGLQRCRVCSEIKVFEEFSISVKATGYRDRTCKECRIDLQKQRHDRDPVEFNRLRRINRTKESLRSERLKFYRGITDEEWSSILDFQGGVCAVCGTDYPGRGPHGSEKWHIDHDHACCTGPRSCRRCIRGLLCAKCNLGLGYFQDNQKFLESAIEYLADGRLDMDTIAEVGYPA